MNCDVVNMLLIKESNYVTTNKHIQFQLKKLGVMPPEQPLPMKCNRIYQIIWANNGDAISRQYAGTAALKVKKRERPLLQFS